MHIATVHFGSARWIEPQLAYVQRHVRAPLVWGSLDEIDGLDPATEARFHRAVTLEGRHAPKLNALAAMIADEADPDDIIVFLDGDAFPIAPLDDWLVTSLASRPLVAVQRSENRGDVQPHPSFCATTVRFWLEIGGDWRAGPTWTNSTGDTVTDVGARLWQTLADQGIEWTPLLRSNVHDLHPLFFAIYGDRVYHHGAGFRDAVSRADSTRLSRILRRLGDTGEQQTPGARARGFRTLERWALGRTASTNQERSDEIFDAIERDPEFFRRFL